MRREEGLPLLSLLTAPFIIGVVAVSPLGVWNIIVKAMGAILAIAFLIRIFTARVRVSTEVLLYMGWIVWSLTGVFVAVSVPVMVGLMITLTQILIMTFIVAGATYLRKTLTVNLMAFLAGVLIVGMYSYVTGEYSRPEDPAGRVAGIALNSNGFGFLMVCGTMVLAYLWMLPYRRPWLWYGPILVAAVGAAVATLLSGSRTAIISMVAFYVAWFFFCYRGVVFRRPKVLAVVVIACGLCAVLFIKLYVGSTAELRFGSALSFIEGHGTSEGSVTIRLQQYSDGLKLVAGSPIVGVGLDQFVFYDPTSHVAHSEYLEVFSDTGIVGGILYFAIFIVLWRLAGKIAKYTDDPTEFRIARLVRAILFVILVSNLGRYNYYEKSTWIVFASFIGYTSAVWRRIQAERQLGLEQGGPLPAAG